MRVILFAELAENLALGFGRAVRVEEGNRVALADLDQSPVLLHRIYDNLVIPQCRLHVGKRVIRIADMELRVAPEDDQLSSLVFAAVRHLAHAPQAGIASCNRCVFLVAGDAHCRQRGN